MLAYLSRLRARLRAPAAAPAPRGQVPRGLVRHAPYPRRAGVAAAITRDMRSRCAVRGATTPYEQRLP